MVELLGVSDVGPGWGGQVSRQALIAVLVFILAIMVYISIRFEFKMAVTAIIEITHDLIITIGVFALSGREVTPATVIAVLTILGYSLYDTIVVFDRIKENADLLTRQSRKTYSDVVNDSVNQVLARSINTSLTTLIPIVSILIFGGATLQAFAFPLFIGVFAGTYSSIILAPPILSIWKETEPKYKAYREQAERRQTRDAGGRRAQVEAHQGPGVQVGGRQSAGRQEGRRAGSETTGEADAQGGSDRASGGRHAKAQAEA
jgi:preprotein translocase subunit SecF